LYSLEPINIGTAHVESLTGYVTRLAEAHCVSVADLVGIELSSPVSLTPLLTPCRDKHGTNAFYSQSHSINGIGEAPRRWVSVLEAATLRHGLSHLTLMPFEHLFCQTFLFRRMSAWCPSCLQSRRQSGIRYESLLWALAIVKICPVHNEPLVEVCPNCHRRSAPLAANSRPGYCSRCGGWLGREIHDSQVQNISNPLEFEYEAWIAQAVSGLVASTPRLNGILLRDRFRHVLSGYMAAVSGGNLLAFGQMTNTPRSALRGWISGQHRPRIGTLLRMCYHLRVPVTAIFDATEPVEVAHLRDDRASRRLHCEDKVRIALDNALEEDPTPSLTEVARRLNYTTPARLYEIDRGRCGRILVRRRQSPDAFWWRGSGARPICDEARIKELLENSLGQEHPTSAFHIAISLGYSGAGRIWHKFPDLCRAIGAKIASNKTIQLDNSRQALRAALEEEPPPGLEQIRKRLGFGSPTPLRNYFPDLYQALVDRRANYQANRRDKMRIALEAILSEEPPPTILAVCERLGLSESWLYNLCPDLIRAIAARHRIRRDQSMKDRRERSRVEIFQIVADLHRQGERPSQALLRARLSTNAIKDWGMISRLLEEAKRELGVR
jgi:hypothetical protein